MIEPHTLDFPPLNCSLTPALGDYYQDFSEAIVLIEGGYHGGMDPHGIPLLSLTGQGDFANAITTAQYALANMTAARRGDEQRRLRAQVQLDWLVSNQEQSGEWAGCWLMRHDNPKYGWLTAPWTGALACGHSISALLRGWEMFEEESYRVSACAAYTAIHSDRGAAGRMFQEKNGALWYEEYPAEPPLHVLNGHIYTLLSVLDYARVTGDPEAERRWHRAAATALSHLHAFDLGYWSIYDLRQREPTSVHYHKNIHIPQLRILAALTGQKEFSLIAERWERFLHSPLAPVRLAVALRLHRLKKAWGRAS